jgi:hypothetical protein
MKLPVLKIQFNPSSVNAQGACSLEIISQPASQQYFSLIKKTS